MVQSHHHYSVSIYLYMGVLQVNAFVVAKVRKKGLEKYFRFGFDIRRLFRQ